MKPISVFFLCFLLFSCGEDNKNTNTVEKPESKFDVVKDSIPAQTAEEYTQTKEFIYDTIRAKRSGFIDWIRPGKKVKKNQTLYCFDNYEAFNVIHSKKADLKATMDSLLETSKGDLLYVKSKWSRFNKSLRSDTLLPNFPKIQYREEGEHFGNATIIKSYNELAELETNMTSSFIKSKAAYSEISWKVKQGAQVKKGQIIAIAKRSDLFRFNVE